MRILEGIEPVKVFEYFEDISGIPRGSGNEAGACGYCIEFAKARGLEYYTDEHNNVLIKKAGTMGKESHAPVMLQGHLDMVCEKNAGIQHDFSKDGIKLCLSGDDITAEGTTLGADNGVAIAVALAVLDDEHLPHPPLEVLFTTGEEVGLCGALSFDYTRLKASYLINIDSSEYGKAVVSCAGGVRCDITLKVNFTETAFQLPETYAIRIRGLKGGHSGADIHLERGNANKLLGRVLDYLSGKLVFELASVSGGAKDNAIPREAQAYINIASGSAPELEQHIAELSALFADEYRLEDAGVTVTCAKEAVISRVFEKQCAANVTAVILALPNGVLSMSRDIAGLVEASDNLGVISMSGGSVVFTCAVRSSVLSKKRYIESVIKSVASLAGASYSARASYPGWRYNPDSRLRQLAAKAFADYSESINASGELMFEAIHAGLECGIIKDGMREKNGIEVDVISVGADIWDMHTPDERLSVKSTEKLYGFIRTLLALL